jgi:hypothetical protein
MDVQDVSDNDQHIQQLDKEKQDLAAAAKYEGKVPTPRPVCREILSNFKIFKSSLLKYQMLYLTMSSPYPPSTTPISKLLPTYIRELRLQVHHRGKYILVKSLTAPAQTQAVVVVVEDEKGDLMYLQLYQHPSESLRSLSSITDGGDIFLLKEPFVKACADGKDGLRVDHVSDFFRHSV